MHQPLGLQPVRDQLRDGDEREPVPAREPLELGPLRHRAILIHDLADHARRPVSGESRQIDRCLGVPDPAEYAAVS